MMPRLRHDSPLPPSHAFCHSSAPFSTFLSTPRPSIMASPRLSQPRRLPPLHDCAYSAAARCRSAVTPSPSLYITPRLRQASKSFATHFLSSTTASCLRSGAPLPLPALPEPIAASSRAGFLSRHPISNGAHARSTTATHRFTAASYHERPTSSRIPSAARRRRRRDS